MIVEIKPNKAFLPDVWRVQQNGVWVANIELYGFIDGNKETDRYAAWLTPELAPYSPYHAECCPGETFDTFNEASEWCKKQILERNNAPHI